MPNWVSTLLAATVLLIPAACSTAPTSDEVAEVAALGQREVEDHLEDPWVAAFDRQSLTVDREAVTPRRISESGTGIFGPFYNESSTQYRYTYHPTSATTDIMAVHGELVASLEASGATVVENRPPSQTLTTDGTPIGWSAHAELEVESLGHVLTIILLSVDLLDENGTDNIQHLITIRDAPGN